MVACYTVRRLFPFPCDVFGELLGECRFIKSARKRGRNGAEYAKEKKEKDEENKTRK